MNFRKREPGLRSNSTGKELRWSSTSGVWALGEMRDGGRRVLSRG
jgi:hypothetical protein